MRFLQSLALMGWFCSLGTCLAAQPVFPSLQLMQIDWQGNDKEALDAAKKSMTAAGFKITGSNTHAVIGDIASPAAEGFILAYPKSPGITSIAIVCISPDPMQAMLHAQGLRGQMEKTPSKGRQVKGSFSGIWVQDGSDDTAASQTPWSTVLSFTWQGPPETADVAADRGLHEMGFQHINGGGANPAHSGSKPREQLTAVVTYAPINANSARVHVLMTGYGAHSTIQNYCRDLKSLLQYDTDNKPEASEPATSPASPTPAALASAVDAVVEKALQDGKLPGMAVGVLKNNSVAYVHGYGLAQGFDPDNTIKTKAPQVAVTDKTIFRWGSVIKTITATTALRLMEEGKLELNDNVQGYVSVFPNKLDPATNQVISLTPRFLLCHQSGLPHYPDSAFLKADPGFKLNTDDSDPMHALGAFEQSTLMFSPGSQTHYSSYGYMLLSALIEQAGGISFVNKVHQSIIQPLGLQTMAVDRSKGAAATGHAEGYTRDKSGHVIEKHAVDLAWKTGAGAYSSNVQDLARWAEALLQKKLLKPATYTMAWTPQLLSDGHTPGLGLGFFLGKDADKHLVVSHNGLADIAGCQMTLFPEEGEAVVIMCNCVPGNGYAGPALGALANQIHAAAHAVGKN